jgi:hypothetical protein
MEVNLQLKAPAALSPRERSSSAHWMGGLVGIRASPNAVETKRNFLPLPGVNALVVQHVS